MKIDKASLQDSEFNYLVRKVFPQKNWNVESVELTKEEEEILRVAYCEERNLCTCRECTTDPICDCGSLGVHGPCSECATDCICSGDYSSQDDV